MPHSLRMKLLLFLPHSHHSVTPETPRIRGRSPNGDYPFVVGSAEHQRFRGGYHVDVGEERDTSANPAEDPTQEVSGDQPPLSMGTMRIAPPPGTRIGKYVI